MNAVEKAKARDILRDKIEKSRLSLDHSLLKICALGVPITIFVKGQISLNPDPKYEYLFPWFALCWAVTFVAVLVSFKFSEMGHKKTDLNVQNNIEKDGWATKFTTWWNRLALFTFLVGWALLVVFAFFNVF